MQRPLGMLVCALLLIPGAVAPQTKLEDNVNQAVTILERFREIPEQVIPEAVMRDAKGLAILTVLKAVSSSAGRAGSVWSSPERQRARCVSSKVGVLFKVAALGGAAPRRSAPAAPASASRWARS
jgi:lipid-binding SYLF domain-containing protein